jgi:ATP-dependent Lon protease
VLRKVAAKVAGRTGAPVVVDDAEVADLLGRDRFHDTDIADRTSVPGVVTGLAVTGAGGDVLFVEATALPADQGDAEKSDLLVTGQLGDVMKESARIALSYVRANSESLGIPAGADRRAVHVHFPAGATPKDGPSAGIAMSTALVSLFTGRPVKSTVAMTGEVTLQGHVLPIGGVKQKVMAAHRVGIREVILPLRNEPDIDDVPEAIRDDLTIHFAKTVDEVIGWALEPQAAEAEAAAAA